MKAWLAVGVLLIAGCSVTVNEPNDELTGADVLAALRTRAGLTDRQASCVWTQMQNEMSVDEITAIYEAPSADDLDADLADHFVDMVDECKRKT